MKYNIYFNNASINNVLIWAISLLVYPVSKLFVFFKISPNSLTFFSIIFTVIAFYLLINEQYYLFLFFWFLNIVFDFCDGQVARLSKKVNKSAFRFDHLSDIIKISLILLGLAIYYKNNNLWVIIFITNFTFLFYIILNHSVQKTVNFKKRNNHFFFNYFKSENILIAIIKILIPIMTKFNGHSLLLFFFLPINIKICLIILIYFNILFIFGIFKISNQLIKTAKK
jgi:phosphatidylglycerophosphate synthase